MIRVLDCLAQQHDYRYVILAAIVCVVGSWITLQLYLRTGRSADNQKLGWLFLAAVAAGSAVWTTHFLAMLGFDPVVPHGYEPFVTLVSWLVAVAAAFVAFLIAASRSKAAALVGGATFGAGVGTMHYTGMSALLIPGVIKWEPALVASSVAMGMGLGAAALYLVRQHAGMKMRATATGVLTLAVVTLHFTAMGAVIIAPDPTVPVPEGVIDKGSMAIAILATMMIVVGTVVAAHAIDRQSERSTLAQFRHLALHDALTELPNRTKAADVISGWLERAAETNEKVAVIGVDLNRFKDVNDVYGHRTGDELLKVLAQRLTGQLAEGEFIARIGGDEFLAARIGSGGDAEAVDFACRLVATISTPVLFADRILTVGASCGIAVFPKDGITADDLIARADLAMYRAKQMKADQVCRYHVEMDEQARNRSELSLALQQALARNELELYYQPQIKVATDTLVGFEALLRWHHPRRGLVGPGEFIPILEETGMILPIGEWVLETACRQAVQWPSPLRVAVNVSAVQFNRSDFVRTVQECLLKTGLSPHRLELEITETILIEDFQHAIHVLRQLKSLGVRIAMDDFGTGYSSLSTLQSFPFDKLKIDRSFTCALDSNHQAATIVRAVIGLSKSLRIPVLAEGVENSSQVAFLRSEACDEAQGYKIGRPMPVHAVERYLQGHREELNELACRADQLVHTAIAS